MPTKTTLRIRHPDALAGAPPTQTTDLHRVDRIETILERAAREVGIDLRDKTAVSTLARELDRSLQPSIVPDRRYRVKELEIFGFKKGAIYKAAREKRLTIKKDGDGLGRGSYIMGAELIRFIDGAPILGADPLTPTRRRGRPPKNRGTG